MAAIAALRTHPTLKNIQTEHRSHGGWPINSTQSKDIFWQDWDRDETLHDALRKSEFSYDIHRLHDATYTLRIIDPRLSDLAFLKGAPMTYLTIRAPRCGPSPLADLPLTYLAIEETPVTDLTPFNAPMLSASLRSLLMRRVRPAVCLPGRLQEPQSLDASDTGTTT